MASACVLIWTHAYREHGWVNKGDIWKDILVKESVLLSWNGKCRVWQTENILSAKTGYGEVLKSRSRVSTFSLASYYLISLPPGADKSIEVILTFPTTVSFWKIFVDLYGLHPVWKTLSKIFFFQKIAFYQLFMAVNNLWLVYFPCSNGSKVLSQWRGEQLNCALCVHIRQSQMEKHWSIFLFTVKNDCGSIAFQRQLFWKWHKYKYIMNEDFLST